MSHIDEIRMEKPRLAWFKLSCCAGCQFQFIFFQKRVPVLFETFDVSWWPMAVDGGSEEGPFDIALVEGSVTDFAQIDLLKKVRAASGLVYAVGSCAVNGGIPALKRLRPEQEVEEDVYDDKSPSSLRPEPVSSYIRIDGSLYGCPVSERDIYKLLSSVHVGMDPGPGGRKLCYECKLAGNPCILVLRDELCMGPVTADGCGALCPSHDRPCISCYGHSEEPNSYALAHRFLEAGASHEENRRRFTEFGAGEVPNIMGAETDE